MLEIPSFPALNLQDGSKEGNTEREAAALRDPTLEAFGFALFWREGLPLLPPFQSPGHELEHTGAVGTHQAGAGRAAKH